jgi:hypothetical protein
MMNIVAFAGATAQQKIEEKTEDRKLKYKYNRVNAWKFTRDSIVELCQMSRYKDALEILIQQIASSIVAQRPNRTFSHEHKCKRKPRAAHTLAQTNETS